MKTNYDEQLTALINKALNDIYAKVKGKESIHIFDLEYVFVSDLNELSDDFLNSTIEIQVDDVFGGNKTVYPYGFTDNGLCINVLVMDEYGESDTVELESLDAYQIAPLADLVNSNL